MVEYHDEVGIAYCRQAVGNDERRAPTHDAVHTPLHKLFGMCVDARGGLVEDEYARVGHSGTSDGQQLAFTCREVAAVTAEHGVVALCQSAYEVVGPHQSGSLATLFVSGVESSVTYVVEHTGREQVCLLQHNTHRTPQRLQSDVVHVNSVVEQVALALLHIVKSVDEVDNRRFTGTRSSHEGNLLAGQSIDIDVEEHLLFRHIAEVDVAEVHIAQHRRPIPQCLVAVVLLGFGIHQAEHALSTYRGIEHGVDLLRHVRDGLRETLVQL